MAKRPHSQTTAGRRENRSVSFLPLLLCAAIAALPSQLNAQRSDSGFSIRFVPGIEWGLPGTIQRSPGALNTAELESPGTGRTRGIAASLVLEWGKKRLRPGSFGLAGRLGLILGQGEFLSDPYTRLGPGIDTGTREVVRATYRFSVTSDEKRLEGALLGAWGVARDISLFGGGWLSYRFETNIKQVESILSPANVGFTVSEASRTRDLAEGETIATYPLRFGGTIGARMEIGQVFGIRVEPEVFLRFDAESLFKDGLGVNALSGGLGIGLSLGASETPTTTPADSTFLPAPTLALSSSVELYEIEGSRRSDSAVALRPQRTVHHRYLPLVPVISAAQVLSSPFALPDSRAADSFAVESLYDVSPDRLAGYTLNLVGERMRRMPEAHLRIEGSRGAEISDYLANVWGIERVRLTRSEGNDEEPDRIELISRIPSLLSPISQRWIVDEFVPFRIGLSKNIKAEAGLRGWELSVWRGGRTLAHYRSDSVNDLDPALTLDDLAAGDRLLPLEAELIVEDYRGLRDTSRASLALSRSDVPPVEVEMLEYWLVDPALHPSVSDANSALLEHLAERARNGVAMEMVGDFGGVLNAEKTSVAEAGSAPASSVEKIAGDLLTALSRRGVEIGSLTIEREDENTSDWNRGRRIRIAARQSSGGE